MAYEYQAVLEITRYIKALIFLKDLDISSPSPMPMHYDNPIAIFIIGNLHFS